MAARNFAGSLHPGSGGYTIRVGESPCHADTSAYDHAVSADPGAPRPEDERRWRRALWITVGLFVGFMALMVWALGAYGRQFE